MMNQNFVVQTDTDGHFEPAVNCRLLCLDDPLDDLISSAEDVMDFDGAVERDRPLCDVVPELSIAEHVETAPRPGTPILGQPCRMPYGIVLGVRVLPAEPEQPERTSAVIVWGPHNNTWYTVLYAEATGVGLHVRSFAIDGARPRSLVEALAWQDYFSRA